MKKRFAALFLSLILLSSVIPATTAKAASSDDVILSVPWSLINTCGYQVVSGPCQVYCWAYCRIILDNTPHTYRDYWIDGVGGVAPSTAGYNSVQVAGTTAEMLAAIYDNINSGRPVMLLARGSQRSDGTYRDHFVVAIGYRGGSNRNNLQTSDILILNPANASISPSAGANETYTYLSSCTLSANRYWTAQYGGVSVTNKNVSDSSS